MAARPIRDRWRNEVIRSAAITDGTKLLLVVMADDMREDGYVSVPREVLAKRLGRNERKISARLEAAVTARLLDRVVRGNRGRTAVYRALLPGVQSLPVSNTLSDRKAAGSKQPIEVEKRHPMEGERLPHGGPTSTKAMGTEQPSRTQVPHGATSALPSSQEREVHEVDVRRARPQEQRREDGEPQQWGSVIEGLFGKRGAA